MTRRGVTLVEILIVTTIGALVLLPTMDFLISSQKSAAKGFDKLETLESARMILEKVQRDLRALCSGPMNGFVPMGSTTITFSFPAFPGGAAGLEAGGDVIPVNQISYVFDRENRTLTRTVRLHPDLAHTGAGADSQIIGRNVASFTICPKEILTMRYYDVEVVCQNRKPGKVESRIVLRTAVCSDYESRLERHPFHFPNRRSRISFPP